MKPSRAAAGLVVALASVACVPQELVLRRSAVDWEGYGVRAVAVVAVPPESPRPPAPPFEVPAAPPAEASGEPFAVPDVPDLEGATRDASELLAFALRQSAVTVETGSPGLARLEVTVKEIALSSDREGLDDVTATPSLDSKIISPDRRRSLLTSLRHDFGYPRLLERSVRATVLVRLIDPASSRPLWFKEAVGSVEISPGRPLGLTGGDPFPPSARTALGDHAGILSYLREVAVRRALKEVADDLLPRYEYREVR